ncbi:heparinase II/III domain-containing protein [Rhizobacter sp. P5_C2]
MALLSGATSSPAEEPGRVLDGRGLPADRLAGCDSLAEGGDWIDDQDRTFRRLVPRDCYLSEDNPPQFWWAPQLEKMLRGVVYTLHVTSDGDPAFAIDVNTPDPFISLPRSLPAGDYRWSVDARDDQGVVHGRVRRFSIDEQRSREQVVPDAAQVLALLAQRAGDRPKMFPPPAARVAMQAALDDPQQRQPDLKRVRLAARRYAGLVDAADPLFTGRADAGTELDAITVLGIGATLSPGLPDRAAFAAVARERLLALADTTPGSRWDPLGSSSETAADDRLNRVVFLALARGLDLLQAELSDPQRRAVRDAARTRLAQYVDERLRGPAGRRDRLLFGMTFPYRSHEVEGMNFAVEALALLAGEDPAFDEMFGVCWQTWRSLMPAYGSADGSDGNGTAYGWHGFGQLVQAVFVLRNALGTDLFSRRAAFANAGRRLVYTTPPITPFAFTEGPPWNTPARFTGPVPVFGDEASDPSVSYHAVVAADREFRLYESLVDTADRPLYGWYRQQARDTYPYLADADYRPLSRALALLAPVRPDAGTEYPQDTPDAAAFPESGQVALHTYLADPQRSSLYFISGRFGSFNHAQAEQNGFVLHLAGEPVLIGAGYYDSYWSPHHAGYTRRTLSKNAITYDGGRGQAETPGGTATRQSVGSADFSGRLLNLSLGSVDNGSDLDIGTGDATLAYRSCPDQLLQNPGCQHRDYLQPVTRAIRSVALWRRSQAPLFLVYDRLAGATPHTWEWNLHAYKPFEVVSEGLPDGTPWTVRARGPSGNTEVCIDLYGADLVFTQTEGFPIPPATPRPTQWHGRFATRQPSTDASFLAVLRPGCVAGPARATLDLGTGIAAVELAPAADATQPARSITFDDARVLLQGPDHGPNE